MERLTEEVAEGEGWRREGQVRCGELQGQLEVLTQENEALRASHKMEVRRGGDIMGVVWGKGVV